MFELHYLLPICLLRILFVKQGRDGSPGPVGQPGIPGEKVKYRNCQIFKTCLGIVLSDEKKNTTTANWAY